jgi:hypothetical protein
MYRVSEEKEERGNDLVNPKSRRRFKNEREEISSRARVLYLPRSWVFDHGEEKEQKGWVLGNDGFPGSFGQRFL